MKILTIERMLELEQMAVDSNLIFPLYLNEWKYLENAMKMPYNDIVNSIYYFRKNFLFIDEVKFMKELEEKYLVSERELIERFKDVHLILRYKNRLLNQQLNIQKKMIKRMWS